MANPLFQIDGLLSNLNTTAILKSILEVQRIPVKQLQTRQTNITHQLTAVQDANTRLLALKLQAEALNSANTVRAATVSSTHEDVVTATATAGAVAGTYSVQVTQLAQQHKIVSASFTDANAALNLTGEFLINGKKISVQSTDTLTSLRNAINQANAGVTASLMNVSPTDVRLTLTANSAGVDNRMSLIDVTGSNVLQSLGLIQANTLQQRVIASGDTAVTGPFTINSTNNQLKITLSGVTRTVTLRNQSAVSGASLAAAIQTDINNAFAAEGLKVTVSYDPSTNKFSFRHEGDALSFSAAVSSDARATLGIVSSTSYHASNGFSDSTTAVGALLGLSGAPSGTVQINGVNVALNLGTDSLATIKAAIDNAGITGVTTAIVAVPQADGTTRQELRLSGVTSYTESNNVLSTLGILRRAPQHEITAARDAQLTVDGVQTVKGSNTINDLVTGLTLNLRSVPATPTTVTLSVSRDVESIRQAVQSFVDQFNNYMDFVRQATDFNPDTQKGGVLLGDFTIQYVTDQILSALTSPVRGLPNSLNLLSQIGVSLGTDNKLVVDESALTQAINRHPDGVAKLLQMTVTTTSSEVTFVSQTSKTKASTTAGYVVEVTTVAQKATTTAGTAQTAASTQMETLTFNGALFGYAPTSIVLNAGNTLAQTIQQINTSPVLKDKVVASQSGGKLVLTSKDYGSAQSFTVVSNLAAAGDNSGIGTTPLTATGVDVAGTINGEAATGNGQFLIGNDNNPNTAGLKLRITSTAAGQKGVVILSKGVGGIMSELLDALTNISTGTLTEYQKTLQSQIDDVKAQITSLEERIAIREAGLREQFTRLERLLADFQRQSATLSQQLLQLAVRR
ncbi:MAG: flagellar filament capping protein FliD [Abditibacteriales bacterium]|nr:flagellar filament capping protein FliD [Abditibacteriales bacterium]MDW8365910.1 flagellar filament capping protein FliD [Abditibacteriales bacterium]